MRVTSILWFDIRNDNLFMHSGKRWEKHVLTDPETWLSCVCYQAVTRERSLDVAMAHHEGKVTKTAVLSKDLIKVDGKLFQCEHTLSRNLI